MGTHKLYCGNSLEVLKQMPSESVDCVVTSPPYWALRDYGTAKWEGGDTNCDHKEAKEKSRYDYSLSSSSIQNGERTGTDAPHWKDICPTCGAKKVDKQLGIEKTFQEYIKHLCDIFDEVKRVLKKTGTCWVNLGDTYFGGCGGPQSWERKERNIEWNQQSLKNPHRDDESDYPKKSLVMIPARFAIEMVNTNWILREDLTENEKQFVLNELIKREII